LMQISLGTGYLLDTDRSRTDIIYTVYGDVVETTSTLQKLTVNSSCHGEKPRPLQQQYENWDFIVTFVFF
jgi:hypothetical protein